MWKRETAKILTRFATIEINSQCNASVVTYWVDSYVPCNNGILQLVTHNCKLITIAIKYLEIEERMVSVKENRMAQLMFARTVYGMRLTVDDTYESQYSVWS